MINSIIFTISFIIILYYIKESWENIKGIKDIINQKETFNGNIGSTGGLRGKSSNGYIFYDIDSDKLGDVKIVKTDTLYPRTDLPIYDKTLLDRHKRAKAYKLIENNMLVISKKIYNEIKSIVNDKKITNQIFNDIFNDDNILKSSDEFNELINKYKSNLTNDKYEKLLESNVGKLLNTFNELDNVRFYNNKFVDKNDKKYIEFEKELLKSSKYKCAMMNPRFDIRNTEIDSLYSKQSNIESYDPESGEVSNIGEMYGDKINGYPTNINKIYKIKHSCGIVIDDGDIITANWNECDM